MQEKLVELIQKQINWELYSAYAYYAVAEFYRSRGLDGFHAYFEEHAKEEIEHAEKFSEYLQDNGIAVVLGDIKALDMKFESLRDPLVFFVEHEKEVTALINAIYREARSQDNLDAMNFLQWYISEQREEEKTANDLLSKYDLFVNNDPLALYHLEKDLVK